MVGSAFCIGDCFLPCLSFVGEMVRSPPSLPWDRAWETRIVTQEMGMLKVWNIMEYYHNLYFPLWGLGNCWVDLGGVPACQERGSAQWLPSPSAGGADKVFTSLARHAAPRGQNVSLHF